jgi:predicted ATP-grasp superfamily ATP-dependent carboligase
MFIDMDYASWLWRTILNNMYKVTAKLGLAYVKTLRIKSHPACNVATLVFKVWGFLTRAIMCKAIISTSPFVKLSNYNVSEAEFCFRLRV